MGILLGLSILIKPSAQPLWLSTVAVMAYKYWSLSCPRQVWKPAMVMLAAMGVLLAPQYIRNRICFGRYCLVCLTGYSLWLTVYSDNPWAFPLPLSDGPQTRRLLAEVPDAGRHMSDGGIVAHCALRARFFGARERRTLGAGGLESIRANPFRFLEGRVVALRLVLDNAQGV